MSKGGLVNWAGEGPAVWALRARGDGARMRAPTAPASTPMCREAKEKSFSVFHGHGRRGCGGGTRLEHRPGGRRGRWAGQGAPGPGCPMVPAIRRCSQHAWAASDHPRAFVFAGMDTGEAGTPGPKSAAGEGWVWVGRGKGWGGVPVWMRCGHPAPVGRSAACFRGPDGFRVSIVPPQDAVDRRQTGDDFPCPETAQGGAAGEGHGARRARGRQGHEAVELQGLTQGAQGPVAEQQGWKGVKRRPGDGPCTGASSPIPCRGGPPAAQRAGHLILAFERRKVC